MTKSPESFADRPGGSQTPADEGGQPHDVLSELLRTVRVRGEHIFCCTPRSPFAVLFDHPGGTLHIVQHGEVALELEGDKSKRHYGRGDVVLLPAGRRHTLRHGRRVPARPPAPAQLGDDTAHSSAGARWLSGTFAYDESRAVQLLNGLPHVIELRGAGERSLVWLDVSSQMLVQETTALSQGSAVMVSKILDVLFIQVLRAWATSPNAEPGWLTGAMDPVIGEAIAAIHANPRHPWTVARLAQKSNLSRSAFSERFATRAGRPPATYIAQVRLAGAADLLLDTTKPISAIASDVGYESEAAFSRAFSRRYGMPPSTWRRAAQER